MKTIMLLLFVGLFTGSFSDPVAGEDVIKATSFTLTEFAQLKTALIECLKTSKRFNEFIHAYEIIEAIVNSDNFQMSAATIIAFDHWRYRLGSGTLYYYNENYPDTNYRVEIELKYKNQRCTLELLTISKIGGAEDKLTRGDGSILLFTQKDFERVKSALLHWMQQSSEFKTVADYKSKIIDLEDTAHFRIIHAGVLITFGRWEYWIEKEELRSTYESDDENHYNRIILNLRNNRCIFVEMGKAFKRLL